MGSVVNMTICSILTAIGVISGGLVGGISPSPVRIIASRKLVNAPGRAKAPPTNLITLRFANSKTLLLKTLIIWFLLLAVKGSQI